MQGRGPCRVQARRRDGLGGRVILPFNSPDEFVFHNAEEADKYVRELPLHYQTVYSFSKIPWKRMAGGVCMTQEESGESVLKSDPAERIGTRPRPRKSRTEHPVRSHPAIKGPTTATPTTFDGILSDVEIA